MLGRTLSLLMLLGSSTGLTLTRDENIALVKKSATIPATSVFGSPLDSDIGIHVSENIVLAFAMQGAVTVNGLAANPSNDKNIVITATTVANEPADVRTIPANDDQVSIHVTKGTGSQVAADLAFVTINPYKDLLPGRTYGVVTEAGAFVDWNVNDNTEEASAVYTAFSFTTVGSCKDSVLTGTDTQKAAACVLNRDDCIWTGTACEASVIVVSGQLGATTGSAACNGDAGTQHVNGDILTGAWNAGTPGCAATVCLNGNWVSRGLRNGKPVYSRDWDIPLKNGGSRFQFEDATSATLTEHRPDAGWVGVCGGAVRFGAPTASTAKNPGLVTAATWTSDATNAQAGYATGTLVVTEATCVEPTTKTGYSFPAVAAGDWTRGAFAPTGISCASGYGGTAKAANCDAAGGEITVSGCSKNSRRRRRKHHKHSHWDNNDAAAPFNPFWWFR